ncbi:hypothetical protein GCM10022631_05400 [Deinococcus rubellus]|uniref:DUF5060 domain-containing protein n=1 Tax=Deinococcus rubellus TaxID=1889240 RepID=A0ABY5YH45_9DEIO|nr:DUF5060 domain-containing protein [Deinococcus rubellus]UWX64108.1 DUF5060 domain-containing protein [Deinococcus rubellus]
MKPKLLALGLSLSLFAAAQTNTAPTQLSLSAPENASSAFNPTEFSLSTDGSFANPYDPAQAELNVSFTSPAGKTVTVPAFWYQDFDRATLQPKGTAGWRVRFTPTLAGTWTASATFAKSSLKSAPLSFNVVASNAPGFVRIDKQNPRYFALDNGTNSFYFPIGLNIGWANQQPGENGSVLATYGRWLTQLSKNGGTIARVWMAPWSFAVEWNDTDLGDYSKRQLQAWLLDQVFEMAREKGVNIELTLINHGQFSSSTNDEWKDNPFNVANGGFLKSPDEFATNPKARDLFKRKLRYIAARYAAQPNLFAWEWWNEVNWTPIGGSDLKDWIVDMTGALKTWDPYNHLISSSYSTGGTSDLWAMPEVDFSQQHDYGARDPLVWGKSAVSSFTDTAPNKPVLLAEVGYSAGGTEAPLIRDKIHFHNSIWAAPFVGYASTGMYWWWDTFVDPENQWPQYKGLSDFLKGENLATMTGQNASVNTLNAAALTLQSKTRALIWLRSSAYDAGEANTAYTRALIARKGGPDWQYVMPIRYGSTVKVSGLGDGAYTAYWYAPQKNVWLSAVAVTVKGGSVTLSAPTFDKDLAVKLVPAGEPRTP